MILDRVMSFRPKTWVSVLNGVGNGSIPKKRDSQEELVPWDNPLETCLKRTQSTYEHTLRRDLNKKKTRKKKKSLLRSHKCRNQNIIARVIYLRPPKKVARIINPAITKMARKDHLPHE